MSETVNTQFDFSGFNTLKKDLREATNLYQQMVASGQASAEQIKAQAGRVAELKDRVDDANDAVKALTGAGQFRAFGAAVTAVAGGFSAVQGAIALAGGESEDFQKTMVKLQAAMSVTQGLSQLEDLGNAFGNLKKVAVNAFNGIKAAIGSTGIGLLVIALGTIVAYWDDIKEAVSGVSEEQAQLNAETAENLALNEKNLEAIEANENVLKLAGKSEKEIYQLKLDQLDATILTARANIENAEKTKAIQVETARRNKDILQGLIRLVTIPITAVLAGIDQIAKAVGKELNLEQKFSGGLASLIFDPEETEKKGNETVEKAKQTLTKLENQRAGLILKQRADDNSAAQKTADDQKKRFEDAEKARKEHEQKITEISREEALKRQDQLTQDLEKIDESYEEKLKLAEGNEQLTTQLMESLRAERLAKIKEYEDKELQAQKDRQDKAKEATKNEYDDTIKSIRDFYTKKEIALKQDAAKGLISAEQLAEKLKQLEIERLEAEITAAKDYGQEYIQIQKEKTDAELALAEQTGETKKRLSEEEIQNAVKVANASFDLGAALVQGLMNLDKIKTENALANANLTEAEREKIAKDSFERQKKLQYAGAIIDGAKAVTSILAQYPKFDGGIAMGIALATAAITTAFQLAVISKTQYQSTAGAGMDTKPAASKFASGGMIFGPGHDQGGVKTPFGELEGGEFIVNKVAAAAFLPVLEKINSMGQRPSEKLKTEPTFIKTYVVASDMTSEQEKMKKLRELSSL